MVYSSGHKFVITDEGLPLIEVNIRCGQNERHGYFYIDTCSSINIINEELVNLSGPESSFRGFGNECSKSRITAVEFSYGGEKYVDVFHAIAKRILPEENEYEILGILGVKFMKKHSIVINNKKKVIRMNSKSDLFASVPVIKMDYTDAGLPLIKAVVNGREQWCLVATGSSFNIACEPVFGNHTFKVVSRDEANVLFSFGDKIMTLPAELDFDITQELQGKTSELHFREKFSVPIYGNKKNLEVDNGREIRVLLGNEFVRKHKWIIDFGNNVIYPEQV